MPNDTNKLKALASYNEKSAEAMAPGPTEERIEPPFILNKKGNVENDTRNAVIFVKYCLPDSIRYNTFSNQIEIYGSVPWSKGPAKIRGWSDTDTCNALMYANDYGLKNKQTLEDAICIYANRNTYHPIMEYLEALSYQGDGYIKRLAVEYMGCEDSEYTYEVMKLLLLAMVQRVYHPGCKFDYVVIFVGNQGTYKSSFWRTLARDDSWFTDSVDSFGDRKKLGELIQGKWLVELGEMSAFRKSEIESIKAAITTQVDSYREAYGKHRSDYNRTAIFVGTTNNKTFLKDSTGNRRFLVLPIDETRRTKDLFKSKTRDADFDGALAEALHIFKESTKDGNLIPLILPKSVLEEAQERQNNANAYEEWTGLIEAWLDDEVARNGKKYTAAIDVWCNCFNKDKGTYTNREAYRINQILDALPHWERAGSVKIVRRSNEGYKIFDYHGRGYRYAISDDVPAEIPY